jgi:hypothetical protein
MKQTTKKGYLGITLLVLVGIGFLDPNLKSFFKPPVRFPCFFVLSLACIGEYWLIDGIIIRYQRRGAARQNRPGLRRGRAAPGDDRRRLHAEGNLRAVGNAAGHRDRGRGHGYVRLFYGIHTPYCPASPLGAAQTLRKSPMVCFHSHSRVLPIGVSLSGPLKSLDKATGLCMGNWNIIVIDLVILYTPNSRVLLCGGEDN